MKLKKKLGHRLVVWYGELEDMNMPGIFTRRFDLLNDDIYKLMNEENFFKWTAEDEEFKE